MPVTRTLTRKDGSTFQMRVLNRHPDGTEFLPEEFTIPYNEQTKAFYALHFSLARKIAEQEALKAEQAEREKSAE